MKIVKLIAENVKRLHAVEITPGDNPLVTIGGKNSAGKSSVLDSIAYAMGGEKLVPSEPIRTGETEAKIVADLGDLVVTRRFTRKKNYTQCEGPNVGGGNVGVIIGHEHNEQCQWTWSETKSTLIVANKEGARYPSPQAVLDRLLGKLTFDPLQFAREGETADGRKRQADTLRKLVGIDITLLEEKRELAFAERTMLKKSVAIKEAQLMKLSFFDNTPETAPSMNEVLRELQRAEELRKVVEEAQRSAKEANDQVFAHDRAVFLTESKVKTLETQLNELRALLVQQTESLENARKELTARDRVVEAARAAVPDITAIRAKIADVESINKKVTANREYKLAKQDLDDFVQLTNDKTVEIEGAEKAKQQMLASAVFPVEGLGLSDEGVTFNQLPFTQAGKGEQIRVSVAIGIALNPKLRVLLIRDGSLLDEDALKTIAEQAETASMQIWCEYVTEEKDEVSVMLVDGELV